MTRRMTTKRVRRLIEAYGADPSRWPAGEREAAPRLRDDPALASALASAGRLDAALERLPRPAPASEGLYARLIALADQPQRQGAGRWLAGWLAGAEVALSRRALAGEAATLAAALAAGLWLAASNLAGPAEATDLSPYVLGGEIALLDEGGR